MIDEAHTLRARVAELEATVAKMRDEYRIADIDSPRVRAVTGAVINAAMDCHPAVVTSHLRAAVNDVAQADPERIEEHAIRLAGMALRFAIERTTSERAAYVNWTTVVAGCAYRGCSAVATRVEHGETIVRPSFRRVPASILTCEAHGDEGAVSLPAVAP